MNNSTPLRLRVFYLSRTTTIMYLHQYDYLFVIGTIFAFLDAWNIGTNDVANSFATSVSLRSLTYLQAMEIASVMEFSGSRFEKTIYAMDA
ncbi:hypothetical protein BDZ45DRAFT_681712 [Acephala macrosclerotiorum]|nr:hypothetical protein BDZ45DRAFT_681712 [Acephala macrosclerotiorum]